MNTENHPRRSTIATVAIVALILAACGGSDDAASPDASTVDSTDSTDSTDAADSTALDVAPTDSASDEGDEPAGDAPAATSGEQPADEVDETEVDATDTADTAEEGDGGEHDPADFAWRQPPSGDPIVIGMVNSEGSPGLDFPEMRTDTDLAVEYLNQHGGMGGRPIEIEHCAAAGSPESSQACAQELVGKGVEIVMLGLDLFPGYDTYAASGTPVVGALPILPADYTADALFVTGGNLTTMAAMVALAVERDGAATAGIISADNPGANGSEASLKSALDKAGIDYVSVKGGDNETDAGFQGLMREATANDPDVLFSLYADAGCIGAMRARVSLGVTTPAVSTAICASAEVTDVVGDDAVGWSFIAVGSADDDDSNDEFLAIIEPAYGDVDGTALGLGALGISQVMTLARIANSVADAGGAVTGQSIYDALGATTDVTTFPNDNQLQCGAATAYPSVCSFEFPIGEYLPGGEIATIPGFDSVSVIDYLP